MAIREMQAPQGPVMGHLVAKTGVLMQYAGALVSLALVAGVGVWGYKLLVRDMTGIPVVRAMEGPVRETPSNPGGEVVPHLGLSVNEVAAAGEAAPPEERLLLAPVAPALSEEDLLAMPTAEAGEPMIGATDTVPEAETPVAAIVASPAPTADPGLLAAAIVAPETAPEVANLPVEPAVIGSAAISSAAISSAAISSAAISSAAISSADGAAMTAAEVLALADQIAAGAAPLSELAAGPDVPVVVTLDGVAPVAVIDRAVPGVATALVPPSRPGSITAPAVIDQAVAAAIAPPSLTADIPVGTNLVQLGAYETPEIAAQEWDKLQSRFAEFMTGKDRVIQQASSGGRTFFRLRAMGYTDLSDARRFCAALAAEEAACIPVVVR